MPSVKVRENEPFEFALRRFKRTCEKADPGAQAQGRRCCEASAAPLVARRHQASAPVLIGRIFIAAGLPVAMEPKPARASVAGFLRFRVRASAPAPPTTTRFLMSMKQQLTEDMKAAMKAGEKHKLGVIRLINAAIKQREVDERIELDDTVVIAVLDKMVKQRKDSVSQYEAANREDLAEIERAEIVVIEAYLPAKMGEAEIVAAIQAAIAETGASGPADMGKLMGALKPKLAGQADMGLVSKLVKQLLA